MLLSLLPVLTASAVSPDIVISQVYGGGGNTGSISTSPEVNPAIPTQSTMQSQSSLNASPDGWEWVDGTILYSYVADWMGNYPVPGIGTYVGYWQNADDGQPAVNSVYYVHVVTYGINSPQWGTQGAYMTFQLPPNTSLAISLGTPIYCFGGAYPLTQFTCGFSLQLLAPGQYAIPSGEAGNVWPVAAGAGWEFQIPVITSTTLNNSQFTGAIHIIDGYGSPWLYPYVAIYVWPGVAPGAFNKTSPSNGATGLSTTPTLSWGTSSGATSYDYCYDTTNDGTCSTSWVNNGTATSKTLSGLTADTFYYWHIRAVNSNGTTYSNGSNTAFWSFKTAAPASPPGAFDKSSPSNGATGLSTAPTLSWGTSNGATSYDYCYDTTNDNACSTSWVDNGTATSKTLGGLTTNTIYYWHIRAVNGNGTTYSNGSSTAFWSFRTALGPPPGAFTKSSPSNGSNTLPTSLTLSWSASNGATSYWYCYDTSNDNDCSPSWVNNGAATSKTIIGLTADTFYYWHVHAYNNSYMTYSNGSSTAFWSFKTAAPGEIKQIYLPLTLKD
jgi:hypothetical protein